MKSIRTHKRGGPEQLVYEESPNPVMGTGDALVRVFACAITPTELSWSATYTDRNGVDRTPSIPGHELSGVVESVPPDESELKIGDVVYALTDFWRDGAAADYIAVQATDLAPKPATLTHTQAAAVPLSALTAWQALFDHADLSSGQRVLIQGAAGGVGSYAVQLAHDRGAYVIATAQADAVDLLRELGADEVVDYSKARFEDAVRDVDAVLDTVGGDTLDRSWGALRRGGALVTIAGSAPPEKADRFGVRGIEFIVKPNRTQLIELGRLVDARRLRPIVEATFPLENARAAFERGLQGHNRGKIILQVAEQLATETGEANPASPSSKQKFANSKQTDQDLMRIAVVGTGVVGGYFGGYLANAGQDVVFVDRDRTLQALREQGLRVDDLDGSFLAHPVRATDDPSSIGPVDAVLLAVKGWQVEGAIQTMRPLMGPDTFVVPLMDGVEAPDQLAAAFGKQRVAGGLAVMLGRVIAPAHIKNTLPQTSISLGELDGHTSERIVRLQKAFESSGITATVVPDILSARWEKLILVGPWSAVGAVTRAPLGVVRDIPETRKLLQDSMNEVLALARACGAHVPDSIVNQSLASLDRAPANAIGNMRDIVEGRPSELETEIGAIVRLAQALKLEVPRLAFLYASLLPQERQARGEIQFPSPTSGTTRAA